MKRLFPLAVLFLTAMACQRNVVFEDPLPKVQSYCSADPFFLGSWQSDSVWIETTVDSLPDSLILNQIPGLTYVLQIDCGDVEKQYLLRYFNGAGVETQDVLSTNFIQLATDAQIFGQTDSLRLEPEQIFKTDIASDSTFKMQFSNDLGSGQVSEYQIFFRRA